MERASLGQHKEFMLHHHHVAEMQSELDRKHLSRMLKYIEKSKEITLHELNSDERKLQQALLELEVEKEVIRRKGSIVKAEDTEQAGPKTRSKKRIHINLVPGRIDPENAPPPNSHDVAIRILYDKKKSARKKKEMARKSGHVTQVVAVDERIPKSYSYRDATFRLPDIDKPEKRRKSVNDPVHYKIRERKHSFTTEPLHDGESGKQYRKTPYPNMVLPAPDLASDGGKETEVKQTLAPSVSAGKEEVGTVKEPPRTPQQAWVDQGTQSNHNVNKLPDVAHGKSSLVELRQGKPQNADKEENRQHRQRKHSIDSRGTEPRRGSIAGYSDAQQRQFDLQVQTATRRRLSVPDPPTQHDPTLPTTPQGRRASYCVTDKWLLTAGIPADGTGGRVSRRGSMDSRQGRDRSASVAFDPDPQIEAFMRMLASRHGNREDNDGLQMSALYHYYQILKDSESNLLQSDSSFEVCHDSHMPLCTLKRNQRRKIMALMAVLKQLPSFKASTNMDPLEMLNCSYLRLPPTAVEQLEAQCRLQGRDPGIHPHMTQQQVEDYFTEQDQLRALESDPKTPSSSSRTPSSQRHSFFTPTSDKTHSQ